VIERKDVFDYSSSFASKRLVSELLKITNVDGAEPRLLIEGSIESVLWFKDWDPQAILQGIRSVIEDWHVPVHWVPSISLTPNYIRGLYDSLGAKPANGNAQLKPIINVRKHAENPDDRKRALLESIAMIGPRTADRLLKKFGSIQAIAAADISELREVELIGNKKAQDIKEALSGTYKAGLEA
jgi:DNA excision repair protein ERCC-4